jgi:hypothetical protein
MMKAGTRNLLLGAIVALFVVCIGIGKVLSVRHTEYEQTPDTRTPLEALAPAMLGFRQVAASLLWVKTDDYFHRGEYEPILRMVRLITAIDPHQIDVYTTGAWHMSYNFMDKRLIRSGLEFLEDGVKNNPNIYDLYFESGWTNMDKMKDFPRAIDWYTIASTKGTTDGKTLPPAFTWHQLAIAHERAGDIDGAIQQWIKTEEREKRELAEKPNDFARKSNEHVSSHNLFETRDLRLPMRRHLGDQPLNAGLTVKVTKLAPRHLLIEGTINVLDLSRVHVIFRDKNWKELDGRGPEDPVISAADETKIRSQITDEQRMRRLTLEWDTPSVRGGKFKWDLKLNRDPADMGRDPRTIYPLASDDYEIVVTFDPRTQAPFIQDVYGWNGEGITDPHYLVIDPTRTGTIEGKKIPLRLIQKKIALKRSEVL